MKNAEWILQRLAYAIQDEIDQPSDIIRDYTWTGQGDSFVVFDSEGKEYRITVTEEI